MVARGKKECVEWKILFFLSSCICVFKIDFFYRITSLFDQHKHINVPFEILICRCKFWHISHIKNLI